MIDLIQAERRLLTLKIAKIASISFILRLKFHQNSLQINISYEKLI